MSYDFSPRIAPTGDIAQLRRWAYEEFLRVSSNLLYQRENTAVADASAISAYSPHLSGAIPVTSVAATDLDTTAAAVDTLRDEVAALQVTVNALLASLRTGRVLDT